MVGYRIGEDKSGGNRTRKSPHASIGYKPPPPEMFVPAFPAWLAALRRPAALATLAQRPTQHSTWTTQRGLISFHRGSSRDSRH